MFGQGSAAATTPEPSASTVIGPIRPTRSVMRPTSGFAVASMAAVQSQRTPIATAVKPRSSNRKRGEDAHRPEEECG